MPFRRMSIAVCLAVLLAVSGCSFLPSLPDALGGGSRDSESDESSQSHDDGSNDDVEQNPFLDHEVPDTFPSDVPLPDLDILFSLDLGTGWSIVYQANDLESDFADVKDQFDAAGWNTVADNSDGELVLGIFDNDDYQVQVSGAQDSNDYDGPVLSFTVVAKS